MGTESGLVSSRAPEMASCKVAQPAGGPTMAPATMSNGGMPRAGSAMVPMGIV